MGKILLLGAVLALIGTAAQAGQLTSFEEYALGNSGNVLFRQPSFSGSTAGNLDLVNGPNLADISDAYAFTGTKSLKVSWSWIDADPARWLRLTTFSAPNLPNPAITYANTITFHILYVSGPSLGIAMGSRDNGTAVPDGGNGGGAGAIEWIGVSAAGPTTVRTISPSASWQTVSFNIPMEPIFAFTGDGILTNTRGTLEHLAFRSTGGGVGPVEMYIDDIILPEPGSLVALGAGLLSMVRTHSAP